MLAWFFAQADPVPAAVDGGLVRAVLGTFFVLALVAVLAVLLRRGVLTLPGQRGPRTLRVETALSLGDRRSLVIVNVEGRRLLLGLTSAQVSVVAELGAAPPAFDRVLDHASSATAGTPS